MLILIGTVPTAYALNRALPESPGGAVRRRPRRPPPRWSPPRAPATASSAIPRPAVTQYVATPPDQRRHLSLAGRAGEGRRRPGREIRLAEQGAGRSRRQHPQRHVPDFGSDPLPDEGQGKRPEQGRSRHAQRLQGLARQRHQVHPALGQDRGGDRARARHHGRLEAHRRSPSARRSARRI